MPKNGSDHFAVLTHLALTNNLTKKQDPPKADQKELAEAHELATKPLMNKWAKKYNTAMSVDDCYLISIALV